MTIGNRLGGVRGTVDVGGHLLQPDEYELALESPEGVVAAALRSNDAVVTLDTDVTPELEAEGLARDVVREIQNARKAEDLVVTDRIDLWIDAASATVASPAAPPLSASSARMGLAVSAILSA